MPKSLHNVYSEICPDLPKSKVAGRPVVGRICERCGRAFDVEARRIRPGQARFCSRSCHSSHVCATRNATVGQRGAKNPNWRGGVSSEPSRYTKLFRHRFPEKRRVQRIVHDAVASGRLVRPDACVTCGTACKPDAHHDDYTQPLSVRWLCRSCHVRHHKAMRKVAA